MEPVTASVVQSTINPRKRPESQSKTAMLIFVVFILVLDISTACPGRSPTTSTVPTSTATNATTTTCVPCNVTFGVPPPVGTDYSKNCMFVADTKNTPVVTYDTVTCTPTLGGCNGFGASTPDICQIVPELAEITCDQASGHLQLDGVEIENLFCVPPPPPCNYLCDRPPNTEPTVCPGHVDLNKNIYMYGDYTACAPGLMDCDMGL